MKKLKKKTTNIKSITTKILKTHENLFYFLDAKLQTFS